MATRPPDSSKPADGTHATPATDREAADKIGHPQSHFEHPGEVVIDPQLSKDEKVHALEAMEQDARQMSAAAAEGMIGAPAGSGLADVLEAKGALELPAFDRAVSVVLQSLRAKQQSTPRADIRALISRAIEAVEAARAAIAAAEAGQ